MKITIRELKETVREVVTERRCHETKALIEGIIAEKGLFDKVSSALGRVNPSQDVDDPKKAKATIDKAVQTATKKGDAFKKDALSDTKRVNDYHDAVKDVLDKVTALGNSLEDGGKSSERQMIDVVKTFYANLRQSADRLDTFMKTISNDVGDKGLDKRLPYNNPKGLKNRAPERPKSDADGMLGNAVVDVLDQGDKGLKKMLGTKPTWEAEKETPDLDVDDPEAVKRFLKGDKAKPTPRGAPGRRVTA